MFGSVQIAVLLLVAVIYSEALRQHGTQYVGLQNNETRRPITQESRILGGEVAAEAFAPWQVSIQNQYLGHFCGGAIIREDYVLTAASCVAGLQKKNLHVITGTNDWMAPDEIYLVDDIILHCNFDKPLYHNDIALLKLASKITFNERTQKIAIAEEDELVEDEILTMTGWGEWANGQNVFPNDLKKLQVTYMSYEKCKQAYGNLDDVDIGHLCTVAKTGEGACHGDTGGPLVNTKGQLVGIGNWGIPCGRGFPDVFARVSFSNDWIRTTLKGCTIPL